MLTTVLEILGVTLLVAFAYWLAVEVWPPAVLGVTGALLLLGSYVFERGRGA